MAEFLVKAVDATNPDKDKDAMCYKKGDVVQVYPDGTCKESPNPKSNMIIIKVPGLSVKEVEKYTASEFDVSGDLVKRRTYTMNTETKIITSKVAINDN